MNAGGLDLLHGRDHLVPSHNPAKSGRHMVYHCSDRFTESSIGVPKKTTQTHPPVRPAPAVGAEYLTGTTGFL
ncbi:unnamed protein product [Penicillium camemberti]|uniref:Str. FM013 n=1 Tax=Penicillium camemberti (strain FM 013) TaxID=1429867 RepID=A0A0G4PX73_PENC3|nr:unnamed protein product [Penicillium camemberti]